MVRLVLFDIDGTLIRTGGAGVKAFELGFEKAFGIPKATRTLNFSGRTDTSLVRECFSLHDIAPTAENFAAFFSIYPNLLEQLLRELPGGLCEGVPSFMDELAAHPHPPAIGLLTGNIRRGAELKLSHYKLWHLFPFGGFGDDHEDRNCIAAIARDRGEEALSRKLDPHEVLVIGDTPLDIRCGNSIGAKVVAVATGSFSKADLELENPAWAVENLGQLSAVEILE